MVQLHNLKRVFKNKKKIAVGRGGKRGTYSGAGQKGQKARAGHKMRPEMRDTIKKLPKRRGYRTPAIQDKPFVVNIKSIEYALTKVTPIVKEYVVNPAKLAYLDLIPKERQAKTKVKILALGEPTRVYHISGCMVSASAKEKIMAHGGDVA